MICETLKEKKQLDCPSVGKTIASHQKCPAFVARDGALPNEKECWFCKYADFQLNKPHSAEFGICKYPTSKKK